MAHHLMITSDGARLWADRRGTGPIPLVFCHGGPGWWDTLEEPAELLTDTATTWRWDQRGCGRSDRKPPYTIARYVADLQDLQHSTGHEQIAILGHSWGATLALRYTMAHSRQVACLIYVSGTSIAHPATWRRHHQARRAALLGDTPDQWRAFRSGQLPEDQARHVATLEWSLEYADQTTAYTRARQLLTPWHGFDADAKTAIQTENEQVDTSELLAACRNLQIPVLIIDGALDLRPRWSVDSFADALPRATRITLRAAAQLPWAEQPHDFRNAVSAFLQHHARLACQP